MQYYLCPRCQFRVAENKKVCSTCGFNFASLKHGQSSAEEPSAAPKTKTALWSKVLGLSKEKPALG
jgi:predicted amidophosphoribosyltransferase